jgi:subtilisin family serine protease
MSVEATLEQFGVAEVIVSLQAVPPGGMEGLAAATEIKQRNLAHYFTTSDRATRSLLAATSNKPAPGPYRVYEHLGLVLGTVNKSGWAGLKADPQVADVEDAPQFSLIHPIRPLAAGAVTPTPGPTWGLSKLRVAELWSRGFRGQGVRIGHIDTGVDGKHPAFRQKAIGGFAEFDMIGNEVAQPKVTDSGDHGTHTAATIVGRPVNGFEFGVAPAATLYSAKVIEGGNVVARVLGGLNWCLGQQVKIISISLGLRGYTPSFLTLIQALRARGVLPVVAVGNEGVDTSRSPGNYDNVLSVGASDRQNKVATYSSSQSIKRPQDPLVPDLVGPGSDVISAQPGKGYQLLSGTSMATPHIAGLAALLWQAAPAATHEDVERAILQSCQRPPSMPQGRANRGFPDALEALKFLNPSAAAKPKPSAPAQKPAQKPAAAAKKGAAQPRPAKKGTVKKAAGKTTPAAAKKAKAAGKKG